jgi:hypothetical protein
MYVKRLEEERNKIGVNARRWPTPIAAAAKAVGGWWLVFGSRALIFCLLSYQVEDPLIFVAGKK